MIRGGHPSAHVSWYASVVVLAHEDGVLVGALLAHPGQFRRRLSVPGWLRVTTLVLAGTTRERVRTARALVGHLLTWGPEHGYRGGYVTMWGDRPWTERVTKLLPRLGGRLTWTEQLGEGWTWQRSLGT